MSGPKAWWLGIAIFVWFFLCPLVASEPTLPTGIRVLLGGVATRFPGETLKWNAEELAFAGNEKATSLIRKTYRKGWEVEGL